jgi:hypothetical protein
MEDLPGAMRGDQKIFYVVVPGYFFGVGDDYIG